MDKELIELLELKPEYYYGVSSFKTLEQAYTYGLKKEDLMERYPDFEKPDNFLKLASIFSEAYEVECFFNGNAKQFIDKQIKRHLQVSLSPEMKQYTYWQRSLEKMRYLVYNTVWRIVSLQLFVYRQ